jgi:hypothetical protein
MLDIPSLSETKRSVFQRDPLTSKRETLRDARKHSVFETRNAK